VDRRLTRRGERLVCQAAKPSGRVVVKRIRDVSRRAKVLVGRGERAEFDRLDREGTSDTARAVYRELPAESRYSQLSAKALPVFLYVDDFDGSNWVPSLYASEPLIGVHRSDDPLLSVCVGGLRGGGPLTRASRRGRLAWWRDSHGGRTHVSKSKVIDCDGVPICKVP